jgi:hypothetical protein
MLEVDLKQWKHYGAYGKYLSCISSFLLYILFSNKGVKVVLDVPDTMWDAPSAEITQLKKYVSKLN